MKNVKSWTFNRAFHVDFAVWYPYLTHYILNLKERISRPFHIASLVVQIPQPLHSLRETSRDKRSCWLHLKTVCECLLTHKSNHTGEKRKNTGVIRYIRKCIQSPSYLVEQHVDTPSNSLTLIKYEQYFLRNEEGAGRE